jgi:hypothetical protein
MAAKLSRAIELAKMAAEAAKAEVIDTEEALVQNHLKSWQPNTLQGFKLQPAMQKAVQHVAGHLARALHYEGLDVVTLASLTPVVTETPHPAQKADKPLPEQPNAVQVQEGKSGRLVRGYSTSAVLGLFATQQQRNGIVVDGQI